jgi:signal transduction histidine kinase
LIAGVNPTRRIDDDYRNFFNLVAAQISNAIQNAKSAGEEKTRADVLVEIDRLKTAFFSNVSHEFRTPLTLMLGPVEAALADPDVTLCPVQHERLQLIHRNALRLQKLVNSLLDYSRLQAGRMQTNLVGTDLAELTADLASSFRSLIEHENMQLIVDCPSLPRAVLVDPAMWEKIVLNLLSNALKFTFSGAISVRLRMVNLQIQLSEADSGVGISKTELPRLFERFHRIPLTKARTHGESGIGLALVHDMVALHGGTISVESEIDHGTQFTIVIPAKFQSASTDQLEVASEPRARSSTAEAYILEPQRWGISVDQPAIELGDEDTDTDAVAFIKRDKPSEDRRERILIADDNVDMRAYLKRLLEVRWEVVVVSDGVQALNMTRKILPDLIISDVMMPYLDGFGLLKALREDAAIKDIPYIMLSARAGDETRIEGLRAGADDYLVKPFSGPELLARVDSLLMRRRIRLIEQAVAKRMDSVFTQAPVAIAITRGPDHIYELANPRYLELIGTQEVLGKSVRAALPELEGQYIYEQLDAVYRSGTPYIGRAIGVMLNRRSDGALEKGFFNYIFQPLFDMTGRPEAIAIVAHEVTDLVAAQHAAEAASRSRDEFLAMLCHELRNPLAPIVTALHLMRLRGVTSAEKERAVIERQAKHLILLVDDLLDISRVTQGKIELHKKKIEVATIIANAVEIASPLFQQKSHQLEIEVPSTGLCVDADPQRLTQVIANLLTNAAKYTEEKGQIIVTAARDGTDVVISVTDNGIGIAPDMLPTIFDMFVQEKQALSRSRGGLGLGLTIAKSMTQLHSGSLVALSQGIGFGNTFVLRIPMVNTELFERHDFQNPQPNTRLAPATDNTTILIVDDNKDAALMLSDTLTSQGYVTHVAFDGPSTLQLAHACQPDIGLIDLGLPGMDGYELAVYIRNDPRLQNLRLFAVTGYGQETDQIRTAQVGFERHFVKPVDSTLLIALMENIRSSSGGAAG